MQVGIHEAKTHFSRLIPAALAGEDVVITNAGRPVARIVPITDQGSQRELGAFRGKVIIHGDLLEPLPPDAVEDFWQPGAAKP